MKRIEVNVTTGERKVIDLTPEEVADAQSRTAVEKAEQEAKAIATMRAAALRALDDMRLADALQYLSSQPQAVKDYAAEVRK